MKLIDQLENGELKVAIIGLGYVGLPLAVEFSTHYSVIGYDISFERISELNENWDKTGEISSEELLSLNNITFTNNSELLNNIEVYIVTVPTPINLAKEPDLSPLIQASELVGKYLKGGNVVIYESTVYPGATEEVCVPILESISGITFNSDFYVGYSPERINPGDKTHRISNIKKITSGSSSSCADFVDRIYKKIVSAGTHKASSIKIAEAAKVIENAQRDINIAFVNELSMLLREMEIDTQKVLEAASTKWNFLNFKPGLVGGHCIGVDPYYLTHKAEKIGFKPEIILAGRRVNDGMGKYVADQLVKKMFEKNIIVNGANVLVLGVTFKENCPDMRNSKVIDVIKELESFSCEVEVFDPYISSTDLQESNLKVIKDFTKKRYSAVIIAVAHREFYDISGEELQKCLLEKNVVFDLKSILPEKYSDLRL